jgi:hypothetical protein
LYGKIIREDEGSIVSFLGKGNNCGWELVESDSKAIKGC